jgi:hypothetical protein
MAEARGSRTDDLFHAMEARSQLRHSPTIEDKKAHARQIGIEASTEFIFAAGIPRRRATLHPRCHD